MDDNKRKKEYLRKLESKKLKKSPEYKELSFSAGVTWVFALLFALSGYSFITGKVTVTPLILAAAFAVEGVVQLILLHRMRAALLKSKPISRAMRLSGILLLAFVVTGNIFAAVAGFTLIKKQRTLEYTMTVYAAITTLGVIMVSGLNLFKEYVANNLDPNSTYDFRVYSERGVTAWSGVKSQVSSRLSVPERPAQPTNVKVNSYTDSGVYITWETATPHGADRWLIQCRKDGGAWTNRNISTYKGYVASSLDASATYEFRVYAERGATAWSGVRSAVSNTVSVTTLPAQPTNLTVTDRQQFSISLSWSTPIPHGADRWLIQRRAIGGAWRNCGTSTNTSFVVTDLSPNTTYEIRVYSEAGLVAWSGTRSQASKSAIETTLIYYGAKPYVQENSFLNCQGYAFFVVNDSLNWITFDDIDYLDNAEGKTLQQMLDYYRALLEDSGKFLDIYFPGKWTASDSIFTLSSMRSNQWIVCMRAGRQFVYNSTKQRNEWQFDYHFWYRTDTGRWAHKNGMNDSKLLDAGDHPTNDSSPGWARSGKSPFYDSDIRYYRVSQ